MTPDEFISRLMVVYGAPDSADDTMFFEEYRAVMRGNSREVLAAASDYIRDNHERRSWPVPGEIKAAIRNAAMVLEGKRTVYSKEDPQARQNASPAERERVADMVADAIANLNPDLNGVGVKTTTFDVSKPAFEKTQAESRNTYLHAKSGSITERSRRMTGE